MRILCLGDSNTYGYDPRGFFGDRYAAQERWPELIAQQLNWEIINLGANGREIPAHPVQLPPADILLVMLGTNDLLQGADAGHAAARMEGFLRSLLPYYRNILLVTPPPMKRGAWVPSDSLVSASIQLAEEYRRVSERLGISFVDTRSWDIAFAFDGVHFTEAGHHTFATMLAEQIRRLFT